jgi:hypothetical protein
MDDEVDVDDEEADEQPKNKQPRTTPWPCRLQALDLQNRFHFQAREVARKTLNIASLRDMKVTVRSVISVQPFGKWYARSLGSTASP